MTIIGAGPVVPATLDAALSYAPNLVAADGGADTSLALGHAPTAIIGDLDSLSSRENWHNSGASVHRVSEQTSTDFEKCLYSTDAPLTLGVGFTGGRLDHQLAVLSDLVRYRDRAIMLLADEDIIFHSPLRLSIELPTGSRFSIFPMGEVRGVRSHGLLWSVSGLDLSPGGRIGTSNRVSSGTVEVGFDRPGALIVLPREALPNAIQALGQGGD